MRVVGVDGLSDTDLSMAEPGFRQLYDERDRLYRAVALVVGDVWLASDALDEAMTRALARWDRVSSYDSPEGWVYRVAVNWARSAARKRRREDLWANPPEGATVDRVPDLELRRAIGDLPSKYRSVVVARYLLDWSTADTADALGIPEATVKTRLRRALSRLAKALGGEV